MSISRFMSSKTVYRPSISSAAPGTLERHQQPIQAINTLRTASPGTGRHRKPSTRQLLCGAASRPRRRVLAGIADTLDAKQKAPLPLDPERRKERGV
jgi:hypothetical protein